MIYVYVQNITYTSILQSAYLLFLYNFCQNTFSQRHIQKQTRQALEGQGNTIQLQDRNIGRQRKQLGVE